MTKEVLKYYKPEAVTALIAASAIGLLLGMKHWGFSVSILGVIGMMLAMIDKYLWKYRPFSWMFWTEDFSGRYEGFLEHEYRDENCNVVKGKLQHVKIISQTGSNICVFSFTKQTNGINSSLSESKGMFVEQLNDEVHYQLLYNYLNSGNKDFSPHFGTEVIKFIKDGDEKHITGGYYTQRLAYQTRGEFLEMKRVSGNLKHDF
jgi:hypothetical protein